MRECSSTSPPCGFPLTAEQLDRVLTAAEQEALSALEVLDRLVGEQAARRRERSIERRIVAARFAERKTLDTFDWNFNKTIQRVQRCLVRSLRWSASAFTCRSVSCFRYSA